MWLLPYQKLTIRTYLTPDQVYQKLKEVVRSSPPLFSFFGSSGQPYHGKIAKNHFKIYRVISYRNSFLPSVEGEVQSDGAGSIINITIQSDMRILGFFMLIFFVMVSFLMFNIGIEVTDFVTHPGSATLFSLLIQISRIGFVLILTYGIVLLFYYYEAAKAKSFLDKLLKKSDYY